MAKKSSPNQSISLVAGLLILVGVAISYQFFVPTLNDSKQALANTEAKDEALAKNISTLESASKQMEKAQLDLQQKGVNLSRLERVMPATEDMPGLYIQMESLIRSTPNVTATYQLSVPAIDANGATIPLTMTATGTYPDLKIFLANIQDNIRPIIVSSASFAEAGDKDNANKFSLNISGVVRAQALSSAYSSSTNAQ